MIKQLLHKYRVWRLVRRIRKNGPPIYLGQTYDSKASDYVDPRSF